MANNRITPITQEDEKNLLNKSAKNLPENPSQKGFSGDQVKAAIYEPSVLLLKLLQRLANETEQGMDELDAETAKKLLIENGIYVTTFTGTNFVGFDPDQIFYFTDTKKFGTVNGTILDTNKVGAKLNISNTSLANQFTAIIQLLSENSSILDSKTIIIPSVTQNSAGLMTPTHLEEIEAIKAKSDATDVVGTYAELQAYDKTTLFDNDIIKVLSDTNYDNTETYYRYIEENNDFTYIGKSPFYTTNQLDQKLAQKSKVTIKSTGTSTTEAKYIEVDDVEYKIPEGGGGDIPENVETTDNKVTSITSSSTDTQYPSAKAVYDEIKDVRDVIDGKKKAVVLSSLQAEPTTSTLSQFKKEDGGSFASVAEYETYVGKPTYQLLNTALNTTNSVVQSIGQYYFIEYINGSSFVVHPRATNFLNHGDDIYIIEDYPIPDRWVCQTSSFLFEFIAQNGKVDLTNYAKTGESNTFTVPQTFEDRLNIKYSGISNYFTLATNQYTELEVGRVYNGVYQAMVKVNGSTIYPDRTGGDLGTSSKNWKDLYLSGALKDSTYSISVANIVNGTFNVINASDISGGNTLTQAQYDLITNGKDTKIYGTIFSDCSNPTLTGLTDNGIYGWKITLICNRRVATVEFPKTAPYILALRDNYNSGGTCLGRIAQINGQSLANGIQNQATTSTSTSTSYSGALTSNTLYKFSNALTSLGIITNGFVVQTGDNQPSWKIHLKIASGFTFTSADTIVWKSGTPNWNELVGEEIEILFEQSLVANTYNAWII